MAGRLLGVIVVGLIVVGSASADGLPVLSIDAGPTGATARGVPFRYVTLPAGSGTTVAQVRRDGGTIVRWNTLRGNFTVPAVAYDGAASGLSADGGVLVLIKPRQAFPRARTSFAVLDPFHLRLLRVVDLRGDFSFDAISPSGDRMFLVQYLSAQDPTRYAVRAYDLQANRLLRAPVVDPHEPDEQMGGQPISRVMSPDGRWAYTLYDGSGKEPFVHALDTVGSTARCIDLDELKGNRRLWSMRLDVRGGQLRILNRRGPELVVDTKTFAVREPVAVVAVAEERSTMTWPWVLFTSGLAVAAAAGAVLLVRRHRGPALG
jgi:hypothetical protein